MVPFTLPATPHIAKSRMQIAPTAKASEAASDNAYVQLVCSIEQRELDSVETLLIQIKPLTSWLNSALGLLCASAGHAQPLQRPPYRSSANAIDAVDIRLAKITMAANLASPSWSSHCNARENHILHPTGNAQLVVANLNFVLPHDQMKELWQSAAATEGFEPDAD
jgi:hypothetical protein